MLKKRNNESSAPQTKPGQTINYAPSTPEEKKDVENNKDRFIKEQQNTSSTPTQSTTNTSSTKAVTPIITNPVGAINSASVNTVNAYVPGIFEENGNCNATFTKGSNVLTKQTTGFENVSNTQCAPISIDPGFLSVGQWTVVVSYSSAKAEGASSELKVEVK